ncbi:MAG: DUF1934 domain-containing protein [Clostridiales bacterium]|nr:DUF1934 domain-containing protein [Candidatus Crickella equi]
MKKNVALKIKSSQYSENLAPSGEAFKRELELEDTVEILTEGTMYSKDNATYITYEESAEAGLEDIRTMLKLKDNTLRIRRYGNGEDDDSDMLLQQGMLHITRYKIPQLASIDLEVYTNKLKGNLDEEGYGTIEVDYKIRFDQYFSRRNVLEIEVQPS